MSRHRSTRTCIATARIQTKLLPLFIKSTFARLFCSACSIEKHYISQIFYKLKKHDSNINSSGTGKYIIIYSPIYNYNYSCILTSNSLHACMVQGAVILLGVDVSGQTTIVSSLQSTNRTYVCPGEIVTYVCRGVGSQIRLSAPPYVNMSLPFTYVRGDPPGLGRIRDGSIVSNLISTDSPLMVADLIVQNSLLPEFSVRCTVLIPQNSTDAVPHQHKPSGTVRCSQ